MSVDTSIDWDAIKQEIERFFGIPDNLEGNGISAIRAMIYRRRGGEIELVLDIAHGDVGLIGDQLESFVENCFEHVRREQTFELGTDGHPGKGYAGIEQRGDLIIIEYLDIEGSEEAAKKLTGAILMLVGNYANRNV